MIHITEEGDPDHDHCKETVRVDDHTFKCGCGRMATGDKKLVFLLGKDHNLEAKGFLVEASDDEQFERLKQLEGGVTVVCAR